MNLRKIWILVLFLILIFPGFTQDKPGWKGKIEHRNGIKVIKNPKEPLFGEITLELEEDLVIGDSKRAEYMLFRIRSVDIDPKGNLYVFDLEDNKVRIYDRNGIFLRAFGRKGQGPGEFNTPSHVHVDWKSRICVLDADKIHLFDKSGQFFNSIQTFNRLLFWPGEYDFLENENILGHAQFFSSTELCMYDEIVLISPGGKRIRQVVSCPAPTIQVHVSNITQTIFIQKLS